MVVRFTDMARSVLALAQEEANLLHAGFIGSEHILLALTRQRDGLAGQAKATLELAHREALQLDHNYIGTEHILLGLVGEGGGVVARVLVKLGVDNQRVRLVVVQLLAKKRAE